MIAPGTADDLSIVYEMLCANSDLAVVRVLPVSPPCNRVSSQQLKNAVQDLNGTESHGTWRRGSFVSAVSSNDEKPWRCRTRMVPRR